MGIATTPFLGLKKPDGSEQIKADQFNYNSDVIDAKLKATSTSLATLESGWSLCSTFATAGTSSWIAPDLNGDGSAYYVGYVIVGAGGGGTYDTTNNRYGGAGGGGFVKSGLLKVTPGTSYPVVVGAKGSPGADGASAAGGTSSFNGIAANGGAGGTLTVGGNGGSGGGCPGTVNNDCGGNGGAYGSSGFIGSVNDNRSPRPGTGQGYAAINPFDPTMALSGGGGGRGYAGNGTGGVGYGGSGGSGGYGSSANATGNGNGGGGCVAGYGYGSPGLVLIYTRS